jgi:hypothetical protein
MTHAWWWLIVDALAVYRLTVLVTRDGATEGLRKRLGRPWQIKDMTGVMLTRPGAGLRYWLWQMCLCSWCTSVWVALGAVLLTRFWPSGWQYPALVLALSGVAGYLEERR